MAHNARRGPVGTCIQLLRPPTRPGLPPPLLCPAPAPALVPPRCSFTLIPSTLGKTPEDRVDNLVSILDGYAGKGGFTGLAVCLKAGQPFCRALTGLGWAGGRVDEWMQEQSCSWGIAGM